MDTAVDLLSQFTGFGGEQGRGLVDFGIAAIFWALLFAIARTAPTRASDPVARTLILGFGVALGREIFMISIQVLEVYEVFTAEQLRLAVPPLERALSNIGLALVAGAMAAYLTGHPARWLRFGLFSAQALMALYLATASWWLWFSVANPEVEFGQTGADGAFRGATSLVLGIAIVAIVTSARSAQRNVVALSLALLFLSESLEMVDAADEATLAVLGHSAFLAALPLLAYAYIKDQSARLAHVLADLEFRVEERTRALAAALHELEHQHSELAERSATDAVTGITNRRAFDQELPVAWARAASVQTSLSLLMIDVDDFKSVNDTYGHATGDEALRLIANAIASQCRRDTDVIARLGGDEFAMFSVGLDPAEAAGLAERLRRRVQDLEHVSALTVSIGVASMRPSDEVGSTTAELCERADQALYEAKARGRNGVVVYTQASSTTPELQSG